MPLGTPYTVVAQRIARIADKLAAIGSCVVAIDATGVGLPVVDSLRMPATVWRLMPVMIVYADRESYTDGFWRVPKRDLIASLQLAFDACAFTIARDCRDTPVLIEELTAMRANRRPAGAVQYASPGAPTMISPLLLLSPGGLPKSAGRHNSEWINRFSLFKKRN